MNLNYLDRPEYSNIPLLKMIDNKNGDLPFYIRKYTLKNWATTFHRHEYMQINYISQGRAQHVINHQSFEIIKGDIFVIPPYIPHSIVASENTSADIFEFEFEPKFINQDFVYIENAKSFLDFAYIEPFLVSENLVKPRLNLEGKIQIEIEMILQEVLREYGERKPGYNLLIRSLLLKLLVLVGREFTSGLEHSEARTIFDRHRDSVLGALKYIDEHSSEELGIEEIARKFMLSQSYFSYLFKSITSNTFTEYVNGLRITKALDLLKNTDKKVLDICYEVGFNNVNHFNRVFRLHMGLSPLEYRNKQTS